MMQNSSRDGLTRGLLMAKKIQVYIRFSIKYRGGIKWSTKNQPFWIRLWFRVRNVVARHVVGQKTVRLRKRWNRAGYNSRFFENWTQSLLSASFFISFRERGIILDSWCTTKSEMTFCSGNTKDTAISRTIPNSDTESRARTKYLQAKNIFPKADQSCLPP